MSTTKVSPNSGGEAPKHRACDECRSRKLACSKEADGCARCKREGIACHYSPQKPMGRPRKRAHIETVGEDDAAAMAPDIDPIMDIDLSFLNDGSSGLSFLDLLGGPDLSSPNQPQIQTSEPTNPGQHKGGWSFDLSDLSFNSAPVDPSLTAGNQASGLDATLLGSAHHSHSDGTPSLTSQAGSTPESQSSGDRGPFCPHPTCYENKICGCLASLYLALDSLQHLPKQVGPAMRIARNAARTAHDTIQCPSCSPSQMIMDPSLRPPVQAFQNMMILGALLPTIANTYTRILVMVDEETAKAEADRRQLAFSLEEYGGLWGRLAQAEPNCGTTASLNGSVLEPAMWRRTVRALLRVDVYGITAPAQGPDSGVSVPFQIGLKDIIMLMEAKSRARHQLMDAALAAGLIENPEAHGHVKLPPGQKHTCQQIIEIAKRSIEHLVIA